MKKSDMPLFISLMSIFFIVCILLIISPRILMNLYRDFIGFFGFEINYTNKALIIARILGLILAVFGGFATYKTLR